MHTRNHSFSCLQVAVGTRERLPHQIFMAQCGFPLCGNQDRNDKGMAGGLVSRLGPAVVLVKHFSMKRFGRFLSISMYRGLRRRLPSPPTEIFHLRCRLFLLLAHRTTPPNRSHGLPKNCREAFVTSRDWAIFLANTLPLALLLDARLLVHQAAIAEATVGKTCPRCMLDSPIAHRFKKLFISSKKYMLSRGELYADPESTAHPTQK